MVTDTKYDSCSVEELRYCVSKRVDFIDECRAISRQHILMAYPEVRAQLRMQRFTARRELKDLDSILTTLRKTHYHNYDEYRRSQECVTSDSLPKTDNSQQDMDCQPETQSKLNDYLSALVKDILA